MKIKHPQSRREAIEPPFFLEKSRLYWLSLMAEHYHCWQSLWLLWFQATLGPHGINEA